MHLELDAQEAKLLIMLLESAGRERKTVAGAGSIHDRQGAPLDRGRVEGLKRKLKGETASESHRESLIDHSLEESFPASDSPARSAAGDAEGGGPL